MVDKIQAKYDQLASAASAFAQQADQTTNLVNSAKQCVQRLQGGHWIGQGAQNFFKEMQDLVFPGMSRLVNSLQDARTATQRIVQVFQQAEQEAGNLFRGGDGGAPRPGIPPNPIQTNEYVGQGLADDYFDNRRQRFTISGPTQVNNHPYVSGTANAQKYQVTIDGRTIDVYYPANIDPTKGNFHTPQQVAKALAALPKVSRDLIRHVEVEPDKNPDDSYWAVEYGMPNFFSYMTTSNGVVHLYPTPTIYGQGVMEATLIHETGHILSNRLWGSDFSSAGWQDWAKHAAKDGTSLSQYGDTHINEDFSEAFAQYMIYKGTWYEARAREIWPNRFAALDAILKNR